MRHTRPLLLCHQLPCPLALFDPSVHQTIDFRLIYSQFMGVRCFSLLNDRISSTSHTNKYRICILNLVTWFKLKLWHASARCVFFLSFLGKRYGKRKQTPLNAAQAYFLILWVLTYFLFSEKEPYDRISSFFMCVCVCPLFVGIMNQHVYLNLWIFWQWFLLICMSVI